MAGHSKWANIQHRKKGQDEKKSKLFTKLIREITVAARQGGGNINVNARLRLATDKALSSNMTRDTIEQAIKRGIGGGQDTQAEEVRYEGYGPGGIAVMIDCLTDNRNRTVAEVRHALNKYGGNLGGEGSVAYLFKKNGILTFAPTTPEEQVLEIGLLAGIDDIVSYPDGSFDLLVNPSRYARTKERLEQQNFIPDYAEITWQPLTMVQADEVLTEKISHLIDALEDLDDVQATYTNLES